MKRVSHDIFFSPGSRQEVNSTWYPEIEEPIKSHEKHYSLVLCVLIIYMAILFSNYIIIKWTVNSVQCLHTKTRIKYYSNNITTICKLTLTVNFLTCCFLFQTPRLSSVAGNLLSYWSNQ